MPSRPPSLEEVYARIPEMTCRGLCQDSCGPIAMSRTEEGRLAERGITVPPLADAIATDGYRCPALVDGRCSVHDVRPAVCRLWGATRSMPCPHGCTPDGALSQEESWAVLRAAAEAGGGMSDPALRPPA